RDPEGFFHSIVEMMSSALRVPVSMISIVQEKRHLVHAAHGLEHLQSDRIEVPIRYSICQHVVAMGRPLVVSDAFAHPLVRDNPMVRERNITSYMGEPLHGANGRAIGTLCAMDLRARDWTDTQRSMLSIAAMIVEKALSWPDGNGEFPAR
ncbi:MAG: GAF domain-containing protein, partial [Pseudomonadota bacterium]